MDELETVATFDTLGAAEAVRGVLESEGIRATVDSQEMLGIDLFRSDPKKPIRVKVRARDAERARWILRENSGATAE